MTAHLSTKGPVVEGFALTADCESVVDDDDEPTASTVDDIAVDGSVSSTGTLGAVNGGRRVVGVASSPSPPHPATPATDATRIAAVHARRSR